MSVYSYDLGGRPARATQRDRSLRTPYRAAQLALYVLSLVLLVATSFYAYG